jgi:GMP synthase (glutamine-hydrolysing)
MPEYVACLRHELPDHLGVGEEVLLAEGLEVSYVELWRGQQVPAAADCQGVLILGGEMNADETDRHPFLLAERELVRECAARSVPTLGICLGGQVMARAFGAAVSAGTSREAAFLPIELTPAGRGDPLLSVFADGDRVLRWHQDAFDVPTGGQLLLRAAGVAPNQAFRVGGCSWGVQFHPEVTRGLVEEWLRLAGDRLGPDWGTSPEVLRSDAVRHLPAQQQRARSLFRRFADQVRAHARRRRGS